MTPLGTRFSEWMFKKFPRPSVKQLIKEESTYGNAEVEAATDAVMRDEELLGWLAELIGANTPWQDREAGFRNDLHVIRSITECPLPLEAVRSPTLIVHGTADNDVPFAVAEQAHQRVPGSELLSLDGAHHLLWLDERMNEVNRAQTEFVRSHA